MPAAWIASRTRKTSARLSSTSRITRDVGCGAVSERDGEAENRSCSGFGFHPNSAMVSLHNPLADGESNAGSGILVSTVQTFEQSKDVLLVLGREADAVVLHRHDPGSGLARGADMNPRGAVPMTVFYGVADEILKKLAQVRGVQAQRRKRIVSHPGPALGDGSAQIRQAGLKTFQRVGRLLRRIQARHLSICEKIAEQHLHARGAGPQILQELQGLAVQPAAVSAAEQFSVDFDAAQRLLQVVADGIGELFQILIGAAQFGFDALLLVDVGGGSEPLHDSALGAADRQRAADEPAPAALGAIPQPRLGAEWLALLDGLGPKPGGCLEVFRMEDAFPCLAVEAAGLQAGELVPALVEVIRTARRVRGPDDLRHGVGELAEFSFAFKQRNLGPAAFDQIGRLAGQKVEQPLLPLAGTLGHAVMRR